MIQSGDGIIFRALPPSCEPCQYGIHTYHLQVVGTIEPWYGWLKEQLHQLLPHQPLWALRRAEGAPDVLGRMETPGFL